MPLLDFARLARPGGQREGQQRPCLAWDWVSPLNPRWTGRESVQPGCGAGMGSGQGGGSGERLRQDGNAKKARS